MSARPLGVWLSCSFLALAGGMVRAAEGPTKAPEVPVARPVVREVSDHEDFTGRTVASARVDLRARVTGYLARAAFREGAEVKQGDLLFEIDPRPYRAEQEKADAAVAVARARLRRARADYKRAQALHERKALGQEELDRATEERDEAEARVHLAKAEQEVARLKVAFTRVTAPISGRVGRRLVDPGNLVKADDTLLATLVATDPMYVTFDVDERTALRMRQSMRAGKKAGALPVVFGLADEKGFPRRGTVDFANNRVDPDTGTLRMRAVLPNKDRLLLPGLFVRVRLTVGEPYKALLVPTQAVMTEGGRRFVYVVSDKDAIEARPVVLGQEQGDLRVIAQGLKPEDRVVVGRLHGLEPGMTVRPVEDGKPAPRPTPEQSKPPAKEPAPPAQKPAADNRPVVEKAGPVLLVEAAYPGAGARVVEDTVRAPIEEQVRGMDRLLTMRSRCGNDGRYTLAVTLERGADPDIAMVLLQNRLALAETVLPDPVKRTGIRIRRHAPGVAMIVNLFSPDSSRDTLFVGKYARIQVQDELARLRGVSAVTLVGPGEFSLHVWLDPDRLAARKLSAADVTRAIEDAYMLPAAGRKPGGGKPDTEIRVTPLGRLADPEELANLVLKTDAEGRTVHLKDVANIEFAAGPRHGEAILDGKPAVALVVRPGTQVDASKLRAALRETLSDLQARMPAGIDLGTPFDFTRKTTSAYLLLDVAMPASASAERTQRLLRRGEALLREVRGVRHVLALSENPFDLFGSTPCILVELAGAGESKADREEILQAIRTRLDAIKELTVRLREPSGAVLPRWGYPVDLAVEGPEAARVRQMARKLAGRLRRSGKLTDVWANPDATPQPRMIVDIDRAQAKDRDVALQDILETLQVYSGPYYINDFTRFGRTWRLEVQVAPGPGDWAKGLRKLQVRNTRGQMIPLGALVTVRTTEGPDALDFLDGWPMVEITANPASGVSAAKARTLCETQAEEVRKELRLPRGYRLRWLRDVGGR